jgi:NAD(P)H-hydrate repair Nnr-like enzyme with NAD(P)H-hydrate dehydratase domain
VASKQAQNRPTLSSGERFVDREFALGVLPQRTFGQHKWSVGGLLIIAGAPHYIGAAALCAKAAGRAGAGIVNLATPRSAITAITGIAPETAFIPMPDGDAEPAARRAVEAIREKAEKSTAFVVGPGLGDDEYTVSLLSSLFNLKSEQRSQHLGFGVRSSETSSAGEKERLIGAEKPSVVDADALNWLARQPYWEKSLAAGSLVLTPHVGELARLLDCDAGEITSDPIKTARAAAKRWNQVVVLKYGFSVATDGKATLVADDAPLSLATAGSGDVFAGTIGAFVAQGLALMDAAGLALYVGTRAARRVEARTGTLGLVAGDLPIAIAEELAELENQKGAVRD